MALLTSANISDDFRLVLFRTIGFFVYTGFETATYILAALEWIIFWGAAVLYFWRQHN